MSSVPRVFWSEANDDFLIEEDDGQVWAYSATEPADLDLPADAVPLVPQADRDELREAIAKAIHADICERPVDYVIGLPCPDWRWHQQQADAAVAVLADRGLVGGDPS